MTKKTYPEKRTVITALPASTDETLRSQPDESDFANRVGEHIIFGPPDSAVQYEGKLLEYHDGWARIWWPNSSGRIGWRNVRGYTIHEVQSD